MDKPETSEATQSDSGGLWRTSLELSPREWRDAAEQLAWSAQGSQGFSDDIETNVCDALGAAKSRRLVHGIQEPQEEKLWRPDLEFMKALLSRSESFSNMSGYCWDCRHYEGRPHADDCLVGFLERFLLYVERDLAWSEFSNALRTNLEAQEAKEVDDGQS